MYNLGACSPSKGDETNTNLAIWTKLTSNHEDMIV